MAPHDETDGVTLTNYALQSLQTSLSPYGFEIAPFLVGWYNELVSPKLRLDVPHADCVAICLVSSPNMFELSFLPLLSSWFETEGITTMEAALRMLKSKTNVGLRSPGLNDPLDWSVLIRVQEALRTLSEGPHSELSPEALQALSGAQFVPDYAVRPVSRLPFVHVQSAGHVSGQAYFHQIEVQRKTGSALVGCSLHPKYGGWFGFRGVILFPNLRCPNLKRPVTRSSIPPGIAPFPAELLRTLVTEYCERWRDNKWRNFGLTDPSAKLYSSCACSFFNTPPTARAQWVERLFNERQSMCSSSAAATTSTSAPSAHPEHASLAHAV